MPGAFVFCARITQANNEEQLLGFGLGILVGGGSLLGRLFLHHGLTVNGGQHGLGVGNQGHLRRQHQVSSGHLGIDVQALNVEGDLFGDGQHVGLN